MSQLFTLPFQTPFQSSAPIGLARLYFFAAGTTTHQPVYTTAELTTAHDQPVRSSADGTFPPIFLNPNASADYRIQLKTADDVLVTGGDVDNIPKRELSQTDFNTYLSLSDPYKRTSAEIAAGVMPVNYYYPPGHIDRYGTWASSSTEMATAVQAAMSVCASHVMTATPNRTYKVSSDLTFPAANGLKVNLSGATLDSYSTGKAISFTLIAGIYPSNCDIRDLSLVVRGGTGRIGLEVRTSYSDYWNVNIACASDATSAEAWRLVGDESLGTGPYYNSFVGCHGNGVIASQLACRLYGVAPGYRGPNANTWVGGRWFSTGGTAIRVLGAGNRFYGQTVEGGTITAFDFVSPIASKCDGNLVSGAYIESVTNAYVFDALSTNNKASDGYYTAITTLWTDANGTNERDITGFDEIVSNGILFSALSTDVNALDYYKEGTFTPAATFATAGDVSVTYGGSNSAHYTRIGNRVFVDVDLHITNITHTTSSGALRVSTLPFTSAGISTNGAVGLNNSTINYPAGDTFISAQIGTATTYVQFVMNGDSVTGTDLEAAHIATGSAVRLQFSIVYRV